MELTQEGLPKKAGVTLSTLRKFEQEEVISLDSFLKILSVVGGLEEIVNELKPKKQDYKSIDEVLKSEEKYYKPEKSVFGIVNPEPKQVLKDLLIEDGKLIDYLIGKKTLFSNYIIIVYLPITACLF